MKFGNIFFKNIYAGLNFINTGLCVYLLYFLVMVLLQLKLN